MFRSERTEETGGRHRARSMDITSDFARLKVCILEKASRISATTKMDRITIGPQSALYQEESDKADNIENERNSCNIKSPQIVTSPKYNMVATSNGIHFSTKKLQLERERQRQEEVHQTMSRRVQHMEENNRAIKEQMTMSLLLMASERIRQSKAGIEAEVKRIAKQEEIEEKQRLAQRDQEQKERQREEYERQLKEKEEVKKVVLIHRGQCMAKYYDFKALAMTCKNEQALSVPFVTYDAELFQQLQALDEKIKNEELLDINISEDVVRHFDHVLNSYRMEIEKINTEYEEELARKAQAASQVQPVEETDSVPVSDVMPPQQPDESNAVENTEDQSSSVITNQEAAIPINESVVPSTSDYRSEEATNDFTCRRGDPFEYVDQESLQIYVRSKQFLELYTETCKDFLQSAATKKFRFECQKAINIPVNAISGVSEQHLRDKYDRLHNLLIGKLSPNVTQHPQGVIFCKNHLAKKIVSQGETLVSSKPEMAFPVAMIVVALWNEHPDFGELFLAHLHEACPFTVPVFLQQQEGQSNEDYYKSLGCKYSEDGTVEQQDKFLKRMSGLIRLYASITVTRQRKGVTKVHPYGLQHAWRWLAAVLNIEPRADICDLCATLILDMLEVAGNVLCHAYPKQFNKLLVLLMEQYYPRMQSVAGGGGGPLVRLEEFLKNTLKRGTIRLADGMLPPNFF
ncbi:PREDICTED: nucleoporin GLE1 [Vollenhovia emeryi]|uniref:nucleoporin GLE1 n=1 Tax=Vollenhovia emeryi TaxID=411798 RepID=UPI0005F549A7|nr:PREDICTED: nucleoporin GLE1 [Vollenhovia emeryi]